MHILASQKLLYMHVYNFDVHKNSEYLKIFQYEIIWG